MLRNLSDEQLERLVHYFNEQIWETGHLPQQWKDATVILIPKAGKASSLQNLRPISLTSCLGKRFEEVIHTRHTNHLEDRSLLSDYMYGFRKHLSTQDVFLRLKEEVLSNIPTGRAHGSRATSLKCLRHHVAHAHTRETANSRMWGETVQLHTLLPHR